jgi:hypothetical protein
VRRSTGKYIYFYCASLGRRRLYHSRAAYACAHYNQSGGSNANGFLEADNITLAVPTGPGIFNFWTFQSNAADYTGSIAWSVRSDSGGNAGQHSDIGSDSGGIRIHG